MKPYSLAFLISLSVVSIGAAQNVSQQDAPKVQLTARELFYSATAQATSAPAPAAATPSKPAAAAARKKPAAQTATKPKAPPAPAPSSAPAPAPPRTQMATNNMSDGARIIPAVAGMNKTAPAPTAGPALGMRYTILKRTNGEMVEVAPDTVFHAGDRIQFNVETNGPGYLYIVSQGSSGNWRPMFPSAEVEDGSNRIEGFRAYTMPPKSRLVFDEQAGTEKIFIVFARQPEPNLESTIYSLKEPAPSKEPAKPKGPDDKPKQLLVASIDNGTVGHLRETYSRDLIIERVDESTPGEKKEKAMYVVNPTGSQDSKVVADLQLVHK